LALRSAGVCESHLLFRSAALGDAGTSDKEGCRGDTHEGLKSIQALVKDRPHKRTVTHRRAGHGDRRNDECRRNGTALSEPKRGPDEQRKEHVRLRKDSGSTSRGPGKNEQARGYHGHSESARFE
jgi:hypothetical protein